MSGIAVFTRLMNEANMMKCVAYALLFLLWNISLSTAENFRIGSFNIRSFGKTKMSKPAVANRIAEIVSRYDVILIMEVRNKDQRAIIKLKDMLNSMHGEDVYSYTASERLGRSRYTEQYLYFYRHDRVELIDTHQFDDATYDDVFQREPYIVRMRINTTSTSFDLALVGLHAKPTDVMNELHALDYVMVDLKSRWNLKNMAVMGDFNADCSYAKAEKLDGLSVFVYLDALIGHDEDTTVGNSVCAYDRINVKGCELTSRIQSSGIYNFKNEMKITQKEALAISDHFPVEMTISI